MKKKILISETHPEVRKMLARMVQALGHEPVIARVPMPSQFLDVDVFLVNTDETLGMTRVQAAYHANPSLPIIGTGAGPAPAEELALLGIELAAWLSIPFTLPQLREAVERALRQ
jgi:hypothetical protein